MLALIALAAAAQTPIDAERAFAAMAQEKGQWTAFRTYAAPDAVMFTPQPVNAQDFLKSLKDPVKSVRWWPIRSWQSCDGTLAVNTGGAVWPDGHYSRYTTVWQRQPDGGWKWTYDNGEDTPSKPEEPEKIAVERLCGTRAAPPYLYPADVKLNGGSLADYTLAWQSMTRPDGSHELTVRTFGERIVHRLEIVAAAPKP